MHAAQGHLGLLPQRTLWLPDSNKGIRRAEDGVMSLHRNVMQERDAGIRRSNVAQAVTQTLQTRV